MFEQWVRYNQTIRAKLEDDEEEEYMTRQLATQYDDGLSESPPKPRGGGEEQQQTITTNMRSTLFILQEDYFDNPSIFDAQDFSKVYHMRQPSSMYLHDAICTSNP